jgi:hypothetical protein
MKIICPVSSEQFLTKQTRKSLDALKGYNISIPKTLYLGNASCNEIDFNETEHLFIDSDIEFTEHDIDILRLSGVNVVSGAYKKSVSRGNILGNLSWFSNDERCFVAGKWGKQPGLIGTMTTADCTGFIKVAWCGAGFLYVKTIVLKKIIDTCENPVFYSQTIIDESLKYGKAQTSYDIGFALNCMKINEQIWLNCGCQVRHIRR